MINRKPIAFLAVAQIGALVYSTLVAGLVFRLTRDIFGIEIRHSIQRNSYLMSHWGWVLLLVPVLWFFLAVRRPTDDRDSLHANLRIYASGAALFLLICVLAIYYTLNFFGRIDGGMSQQ